MNPEIARVPLPHPRIASSSSLEIVVDAGVGGPVHVADRRARVVRGSLSVGMFGVIDRGRQVAAVTSLPLDALISGLSDGTLDAQLLALSTMPRAALVIEDRYASLFKQRQVRPGVVAELLATCQVRWPQVPIVFTDSQRLAREWAFRFLAAAHAHAATASADAESSPLVAERSVEAVEREEPRAEPVVPQQSHPATTAEIRAWAEAQGLPVAAKGRVRREVVAAFEAATGRPLA